MADIDIRRLTNDAEAGLGCSVGAVLHQQPYKESLQTLQLIDKLNKEDVAANRSIPTLHFEDNWRESSASLYRADPGKLTLLWGKEIVGMNYYDALVNGGKPKFTCSDQ